MQWLIFNNIHIYLYIYIYLCQGVLYACTYIHTRTCMYIHMHMCVCVHIYACTYMCMCMHVHMHVYVYMYIYICVYVMSGLLVGQRLWKEEEKGRNLLSSAAHALVSPPLIISAEGAVWAGSVEGRDGSQGHTLGSAPPDSSWAHPGSWGSSALGQQLFLPGH